jgi:hypothetical protein
MEQFISRDAEGHGEADSHLGGEPQAVMFVGRDQRLNEADLLRQIYLSDPAFFPQSSKPLS